MSSSDDKVGGLDNNPTVLSDHKEKLAKDFSNIFGADGHQSGYSDSGHQIWLQEQDRITLLPFDSVTTSYVLPISGMVEDIQEMDEKILVDADHH